MTTATAAPPMYATVPRLWPGETCVILGGGPSLTAADVDYCRGRAHVIAVKEAWQLAPWADALYACERTFWAFYKGVPDFAGRKYGLEAYPGVELLENTGALGLELAPTGLRTGFNSGYQAMNLAVHFGSARILLLGFDLWTGLDGRANWHDSPRFHRVSPYPVFMQAFADVVEPLKVAGVEVLNCSRRTLLKAFPRVPLEEALA